SIQGRPVDLLETEYLSMLPLPPVIPPIGLKHRIRLARDYYVRVDTVDYSVDPQAIGRFVDVTASPDTVTVFCDSQVVARHQRSWAKQAVVTDPAHAATAARMRQALALDRRQREAATRHHPDGHVVTLRALPDYDALFGVDFDPTPTKASNE
ncbi:Mu transposase domain-containing protein, partial [Streptomyces sp. NPDC055085]